VSGSSFGGRRGLGLGLVLENEARLFENEDETSPRQPWEGCGVAMDRGFVILARMTHRSHHCGWEWTRGDQPGRSETCARCGAGLEVCLNYVGCDPRAACQRRDRRAEPVAENAAANFCEYIELARRALVSNAAANTRETAAREQLKKLLGD
jgi:hypothetical protein